MDTQAWNGLGLRSKTSTCMYVSYLIEGCVSLKRKLDCCSATAPPLQSPSDMIMDRPHLLFLLKNYACCRRKERSRTKSSFQDLLRRNVLTSHVRVQNRLTEATITMSTFCSLGRTAVRFRACPAPDLRYSCSPYDDTNEGRDRSKKGGSF